MPMMSQAQRGAMFAAAAGKSTLGIPQTVGKEFADADTGGKLPRKVSARTDQQKRTNPLNYGAMVNNANKF